MPTELFWLALCDAGRDEYLEPPYIPFPELSIYGISTLHGFIFDDSFWDIFHSFGFHICHIAYYGPERLRQGDRRADTGVFDLRFKEGKHEPN